MSKIIKQEPERRRGRPKISSDSQVLHIRVPKYFYQMMVAETEDTDMTMSELFRLAWRRFVDEGRRLGTWPPKNDGSRPLFHEEEFWARKAMAEGFSDAAKEIRRRKGGAWNPPKTSGK